MPWRGSFGRILTMQLEPPKLTNYCPYAMRSGSDTFYGFVTPVVAEVEYLSLNLGCYMVFCMKTAEVYIGMVGQTAVRLFGVGWNSNGSASIGRPISDRGREHILAMLKCASGKSYAYAMYRYMSRIGAHRWGICPLELCSIFRVFSREQWWQRHAIKLLNNRLPEFSSKDWAKLGRGKYSPTVLSVTDSTTVEKEVSCLRSSLSLEQQFSILNKL